MVVEDYRLTHQHPLKGRSYEESFTKFPYRRIVWEWEQDVLKGVMSDLFEEKSRLMYLDFACGTGRILRLLEGFMKESYGVDVSKSMLDVAEENVLSSSLILGDLTKEDLFPEKYFDLITAFRFFLNAQQDLRENVLRVLGKNIKNNGFLIINIHMNKGCLLEKELRLYQAIKGEKTEKPNSLSFIETKHLLSSFNFEVVQTFHYGVIPIYQEEYKFLIKTVDRMERLFSRIPSLMQLSRYIIYVCSFKQK